MRVVIALGGNALLKRGEPMTAANQRANVRNAAAAIADLARDHNVVVAHGNGPQVGLLALQAAALKDVEPYPLDILGAESVGMIGYLVEQELTNAMPAGSRIATLLTQIEVDRHDPAFDNPVKPIGPVYSRDEAVAARTAQNWPMIEESAGNWRRVIASPAPGHITQIATIRLLVEAGVTVICAGGGGIPVVRDEEGNLEGIEAVIDKDRATGLLAEELSADAYLMLTDVDGVYKNWGTDRQQRIEHVKPGEVDASLFPPGSMGPKVEAALKFSSHPGRLAGIGRLQDARAILEQRAGTRFSLE
ncbi:carbamate kinase [Brucella anthropi]|uniref:carbamate kinase n=1 Tax=Brucella anthropi TaxID=529 RepID=UPI00124ECBBC|nr:carbamate kinase [Brucella anthropi]KAB2737371.1 carbamate kinase [Brucella anthropi]